MKIVENFGTLDTNWNVSLKSLFPEIEESDGNRGKSSRVGGDGGHQEYRALTINSS